MKKYLLMNMMKPAWFSALLTAALLSAVLSLTGLSLTGCESPTDPGTETPGTELPVPDGDKTETGGDGTETGENPAAPARPGQLALRGGAGWIYCAWIPSATAGVTYEVLYGLDNDIANAATYAETGETGVYITGLPFAGSLWYVFVRAKDAEGRVGEARRSSVTTLTDPEEADKTRQVFTRWNPLGAWLAAQTQNTAANPYQVSVSGLSLRPIKNDAGQDAGFMTLYEQFRGRYVDLNLDACSGATVPFSSRWNNETPGERTDLDKLVSVRLPVSGTRVSWHFFRDCISLKRVILPPAVKAIHEYSFAGCSSLEEMDFPATLETVFQYAFSGCSSLGRLIFRGTAPPELSGYSNSHFQGVPADMTIYVPAESVAAYQSRFPGKTIKTLEEL